MGICCLCFTFFLSPSSSFCPKREGDKERGREGENERGREGENERERMKERGRE